jgi:protein SCO1/2
MRSVLLATCALLVAASPAHANRMAALNQTMIVVAERRPLRLPSLLTTSGTPFAPERLKGHWSVVYFGFTSCPEVCPTTLHALSEVARDPASGVAEGSTEIDFVSIDPGHDTPTRMQAYLRPFKGKIQGLTGTPASVKGFSAALGAAYQPDGAQFDHSTSLFVLDPFARLAGVLLRPTDPARIVADLTKLRHGPPTP